LSQDLADIRQTLVTRLVLPQLETERAFRR
jgi:hypothetical protein